MLIRNKRVGAGYIRNSNRGYSRYTGRPMKQDAGAHSATPAPTGGNEGGDGGTTTQTGGTADNAGAKFDPMAFWNSPADGEGERAPSGESTTKTTPAAGQQQESQEQSPAQAVAAAIQGLDVAKGIMSDAAVAELAEGKTDAFHANLNAAFQGAMQTTIQSIIPLLAGVRDQLRNEFKDSMQGTLQSRDNAADLEAAIPSAKNPAVRPVIDSIFNRAMTLTKNDRKAAIAMTKDMLRLQTDTIGEDIGRPPRNASDNESLVPSNTNWLEELSGR